VAQPRKPKLRIELQPRRLKHNYYFGEFISAVQQEEAALPENKGKKIC
jgi:hypothetical protein